MSGRKAVLLIIVPLILVGRTGHADQRPDSKERTARTACLSGDYVKGVQLLSELFVDTLEPAFIYNQGRCFEQNRKYEDAIARFQEYLRAARKATRAERAEAQKHIDDCQELLAKEKAQASPVAPSLPVAQPQVSPQPVVPPVVTVTPSAPTHEDTSSKTPGAGLRTAGVVTASVGAASLVAGLILNLKANSLADEFDSSQEPATKSSHDSFKTTSMICYGVGAVAVVAGTILYLFGRSGRGENSDRLSLVPVLSPSEFSLGVRRRF